MSRYGWRWSVAGLLLWGACGAARADVRLPALFSDHMVVQQEQALPVWGWAEPGEAVTVTFAGQTCKTAAGPDGKWKVTLAPVASGTNLTLTVAGKNTLVVQDVLVGEVWLCSGQSNMQMSVALATNATAERRAAMYPSIRMFKVLATPQLSPQETCEGAWVVCAPETVGKFSAAAYFFGREVHQQLQVPVGLIDASLGGTIIEAWTSKEAQSSLPEFKAIDANAASHRSANPSRHKNQPANLFNGFINPLIPYAIRGAIWYQGESNAFVPHASLYGLQLATLIRDWRARWGCEFPFAWVQLPEFMPKTEPAVSYWPLIREQMLTALSVPHTGMAVALGLGDTKNVHPKNKQGVGKRLALWALAEVYGRKNVVWQGPLPARHEVKDGAITVTFSHTDGGLTARDGAVKGFAIAGEDRKWVAADARIEGETVVVSSPAVPKPVAVRYAWGADPEWSLLNGAGLPASPFRTDTWDIVPALPESVKGNVGLEKQGAQQ